MNPKGYYYDISSTSAANFRIFLEKFFARLGIFLKKECSVNVYDEQEVF
jgi:hypothetical protein